MLCHFYARCNGLHTFQKVKFLTHLSTECFSKSLEDNQDAFWQMWDDPCVLLWQQWFSPGNSPMDAIFGQCLSYSGVMNTALNCGQQGLQFLGCFSRFFCNLLDEPSSHSWSNLSWSTTPGKVCYCSQFSPFVDNGSDSGSLESHSLGNGFVTFSRLIDFNHFFSHFFLNFLGSWHVCGLLHFV